MITPADSPSSPSDFAGVAVSGFDIQAPNDEAAITSQMDAANAVAAAGVLYPMGPRQSQARVLLDSPQGFNSGGGLSGYDIMAGWSGEPDESWDNLPQPAALLDTPIQGEMGTYPESTSTVQEGLQKYGTT